MATKTIVFPSLSEDGWVTETNKLADKLMSSFFTSEFSQSYTYYGSISSFPYILAMYGHDPVTMAAHTEDQLMQLFSRYFQEVQVNCEEYKSDNQTNQAAITIAITFTDSHGVTSDLTKLLELENTKIKQIININNG